MLPFIRENLDLKLVNFRILLFCKKAATIFLYLSVCTDFVAYSLYQCIGDFHASSVSRCCGVGCVSCR